MMDERAALEAEKMPEKAVLEIFQLCYSAAHGIAIHE